MELSSDNIGLGRSKGYSENNQPLHPVHIVQASVQISIKCILVLAAAYMQMLP